MVYVVIQFGSNAANGSSPPVEYTRWIPFLSWFRNSRHIRVRRRMGVTATVFVHEDHRPFLPPHFSQPYPLTLDGRGRRS